MKILLAILALACGIALAVALVYGYAYWKLGQAAQSTKLNEQEKARMTTFFKIVDQLGSRTADNGSHSRVDYSSVGYPEREQELQDIRTSVNFFQVEFGRLPRNLTELSKSRAAKRGSRKRLADIRQWVRACSVQPLHDHAYIVTCDPWKDAMDLQELAHSFDPNVERFYRVDDKILLFVPN